MQSTTQARLTWLLQMYQDLQDIEKNLYALVHQMTFHSLPKYHTGPTEEICHHSNLARWQLYSQVAQNHQVFNQIDQSLARCREQFTLIEKTLDKQQNYETPQLTSRTTTGFLFPVCEMKRCLVYSTLFANDIPLPVWLLVADYAEHHDQIQRVMQYDNLRVKYYCWCMHPQTPSIIISQPRHPSMGNRCLWWGHTEDEKRAFRQHNDQMYVFLGQSIPPSFRTRNSFRTKCSSNLYSDVQSHFEWTQDALHPGIKGMSSQETIFYRKRT